MNNLPQKFDFEQYKKIDQWCLSQIKWHSKRSGEWHRSQERYFRKKRISIADIGYVIQITIEKYASKVSENIHMHNILIKKFNALMSKE